MWHSNITNHSSSFQFVYHLIILFQSNDEPISLCEGIEVSAKFHGAFCEAKIQKVAKKCKS